jgi:hypothetical protein
MKLKVIVILVVLFLVFFSTLSISKSNEVDLKSFKGIIKTEQV